MGSGTFGYSGEGTSATSTSLFNPNGVAVDGVSGDVYTSVYDGARVQWLTKGSGLVHTFAGTGRNTAEYGSFEEGVEGGYATSCSVASPHQLLLSGNGSLYVTDAFWSKVRLIHHGYPPTVAPSERPSEIPTEVPTLVPTAFPTLLPTAPTEEPTISPTITLVPTAVMTSVGSEAAPTCSWEDNPDFGHENLQEVVVSNKKVKVNAEDGSTETTTVTRTYRKQQSVRNATRRRRSV